ncbi:MAG: alpha/beta hydrolase [Spirochaetes bacterium]|nr:alpha/beta hydrolase [Spirochaetota bacterium]
MNVNQLKNSLPAYQHNKNSSATAISKDYLSFFNFQIEKNSHQMGYVQAGKYRIMVQSFSPKKSRATVLCLHGFLDHSGHLHHLVNHLLQNHYSVITFDLPGHGLSSGQPTAINDFAEYAEIVNHVTSYFKQNLSGSFYFCGFSTGCAAHLEFVQNFSNLFDKSVYVSPLIRSSSWYLSQVLYFLLKPFIRTTPRLYKKVSSSKEYKKFVHTKDPFQHKHTSVKWITAYFNWFKRLTAYEHLDFPLLILQGDLDNTVDWKYNLNFFKTKMINSKIRVIHQGRHQLINESKNLLGEVLKSIEEYFAN